MLTSHPPGAMVLQYGRIPCVYGRILSLYGRILRVYGRIPAQPFWVYGRILGGIRPYTGGYTAVYWGVYGRILLVFVANFNPF